MSREATLPQTTAATVPVAAPLCIPELFEAQVRKTPNAVAVNHGEQKLTYRELNEQANQLAHYLRTLGVGPEVPVALYLERSLQMVVAILGVLKAGGAYVPIDLAYPKERLSFMLEDSQAPVLLTQASLRGALPTPTSRVVCLDTEWASISKGSTENPISKVTGENAAYIIYTSGSTGKPKGVLVTHHNVVRLLQQTAHWYKFDANDVWPLFHSYAFDVSVWELWGSLFYGGRLVIVPYLVSRSPRDFYDLLAREKVTVLNQTPSAFRQLIWAETTAETKHELSLRYVICAGEALELQSLRPWFERHGDAQPKVVNMYGITEITVHATYRVIRKTDLTSGVGSVIGVPIPDLQL
ncbi:MAG TPA: AMP-binding protein, partial [Bacillota bacterium]|nr:AMP-binding protein [Bacillota bacterium]